MRIVPSYIGISLGLSVLLGSLALAASTVKVAESDETQPAPVARLESVSRDVAATSGRVASPGAEGGASVADAATAQSQPRTITYSYDQAGRLTGVSYGDGKSITYGYDEGGNLLSAIQTVSPPPRSGGGGGGAVAPSAPPGPPTATGTVSTASGGSVSLEGITVSVPKDARATSTTVTVKVAVATVPDNVAPPEGSLPGSRAFTMDVTQSGVTVTRVATGIELTVPYTDADLRLAAGDPTRLRLYRYDEANKTWTDLQATVDSATRTLKAVTIQTSLFALIAELPTPGDLLSPPGGTVYGFEIGLAWTNPPDTAQFQFQLMPVDNHGPALNLIIGRPDLVQAARFGLPAPVLGQGPYVVLPGMGYTWRLRTSPLAAPLRETDPGWSKWSNGAPFRTHTPTSATIFPVSPRPTGFAGNLEPTLQWGNANSSIFYYEVQLSTDPAFVTEPARATAAVYWNLVHGGLTEPLNSWTVPSEFALEPGVTYYWRARPRVQGDGSPVEWSDTWSFTAL